MYYTKRASASALHPPIIAGHAADTHLFRVLKVLEERRLVPSDALVHVRRSIREALCLTSLTSEEAVLEQTESKRA